jgi:hypothetical protein
MSRGYPTSRERGTTTYADALPRARAQRRIFHGGGGVNGVGGQFTHVQLFCPPDAGVALLMLSLRIDAGALGAMRLRRFDTPLATLLTRGASRDTASGASRGEVRSENNVAELGTLISELEFLSFTHTSWDAETDPMILQPATGILINHATVAIALGCQWVWAEVPFDWVRS